MSFEQSVIIGCLLAPAAIVVGACLLSYVLSARNSGAIVCPAVLSLGWWVAIATAVGLRQGWEAWPDDAWRQSLWPLLAACGLVGSTFRATASWRWIVAAMVAVVAGMIAMPSGEAWSDTFAAHRSWMALVIAAGLVNAFTIERMADRGAARWCLWVAVAGFGGPMALAASAYASLSEWTLAMMVASGVAATLGLFGPRIPSAAIAFPATLAAGVMAASANFYSYESHAGWVYAMMLFGPAVVAMVDLILSDRSTPARVITAALLSGAFAGFCAWGILV